MDAIDRRILHELQAAARLSATELAKRVGLSVSAAHRRMRDLERSGVIRGYRARLDAPTAGLTFEALVLVTMGDGGSNSIVAFEREVATIPHIVLAQRLFGEPDYLLRVVTTDVHDFRSLYDERLAKLPGVRRLTSTMVMATVVEDRPLPL